MESLAVDDGEDATRNPIATYVGAHLTRRRGARMSGIERAWDTTRVTLNGGPT